MLDGSKGASTPALAASMRPESPFTKYGSIVWAFISKVDGDNKVRRSVGKFIEDADPEPESSGRAWTELGEFWVDDAAELPDGFASGDVTCSL
jgi:hypothetical protein